jgi:hypothetical protein
LEAKLAETETGAVKSIAALLARLAETEASATESSVITKKHFEDYCPKMARDLAPMCEAY